jgi:phosphonopyruvate decarboxylase
MIDPAVFYDKLAVRGTGFFTGVPDSLLKSFCAYVTDHAGENNHIPAVNEGAALALAAGYHLATGKIPLVYMQNSGIGNAVNPLLSLADSEVYSIPVLLVIGWRGEPGVHDEPQHIKQGKVTCRLLEAMDIPYAVLADTLDEADKQLAACYAYMTEKSAPYALVVRKDTFAPYTLKSGGAAIEPFRAAAEPEAAMSREAAIEAILQSGVGDGEAQEFYFSTTGMASRELYELREKYGEGHDRDFLTVGSMGHASQIALSVALQKPDLPITCIDGDGAALMHLGSFATTGVRKPRNLRHIVLNNGAHDSVGGQPTIALQIDLPAIAHAVGYRQVYTVHTLEELRRVLGPAAGSSANDAKGMAGGGKDSGAAKRDGPVFIEVKVRKGARKDLGRPRSSPIENKTALMVKLASGQSLLKKG